MCCSRTQLGDSTSDKSLTSQCNDLPTELLGFAPKVYEVIPNNATLKCDQDWVAGSIDICVIKCE